MVIGSTCRLQDLLVRNRFGKKDFVRPQRPSEGVTRLQNILASRDSCQLSQLPHQVLFTTPLVSQRPIHQDHG